MAAYGDGGLYTRGGVWYARTYVRGREVRESLHTGDPELARRRLVALRRKRERGAYLDPRQRRVTVAAILEDLLVRAETRGLASLPKLRSHTKAVKDELGMRQANELETTAVEKTQRLWKREGRADATINRRCEVLRQAYRLAARRSPPLVAAVPHIPLLRVENTRQGFLTAEAVGKMLEHLEPDLADFVLWAFVTGMRKSEGSRLAWSMLDRSGKTWLLRIPSRVTKNRAGRVLPVVGTGRVVIERRLAARRLGCELIFHRHSKGKPGQRIKAFDKAWRAALKKAGLPRDQLFHDLRRSAARNLRLAGASETEAMKVTGHKTSSMFRRYSIVTDDETAAALLRQDAFLGLAPKKA